MLSVVSSTSTVPAMMAFFPMPTPPLIVRAASLLVAAAALLRTATSALAVTVDPMTACLAMVTPPDTTKLPASSAEGSASDSPRTFRSLPRYMDSPTPTPPVTVSAAVAVDSAAVSEVMALSPFTVMP